jgi:hypothetical protein
MMRLIYIMVLTLTIVAGVSETAHAQVGAGRNFGLGFQLGDPTALIGKAFIGGGNAFDFGIGFGSVGYSRCWDNGRRYYCNRYGRDVSLHADYLWQDNLVRGSARLDWHIGVGGRMIFWDTFDDSNIALLARMPLGLDLTFARPNFIEVFFEIAPALEIIPFARPDLDAAIGVRFYF